MKILRLLRECAATLPTPATVFRPCSIFNSAAAKRAAVKLKYKPKIVDGKAVRVDDVPHKFTFIFWRKTEKCLKKFHATVFVLLALRISH